MKGDMLPLMGDAWLLSDSLPLRIGWGAPRPIEPQRKDALRAALQGEAAKPMLAIDPYGGGKELGAIARLALIADE
eukprot:6172853-Prymnesium_polylepis.2